VSPLDGLLAGIPLVVAVVSETLGVEEWRKAQDLWKEDRGWSPRVLRQAFSALLFSLLAAGLVVLALWLLLWR
jgi:hypothetical protein